MFVLTGIGESPLGTTVGGQYLPKIRGGGVMRFFGPLSKRLELSKRASEANDFSWAWAFKNVLTSQNTLNILF